MAVVDLDPQCNLTQYVLPDDDWEEIFIDTSTSADRTIWKFVRPISQSRSIYDAAVTDLPLRDSRFGFRLIPGHPFISRLDDALAEQWANYRLARPGGIEATLWANQLIERIIKEIPGVDFVLFDLGPSLGPLNRSVLMASNSFLSPVSPDLFSLYSFDNLKTWFGELQKSITQSQSAFEVDADDSSSEWWHRSYMSGLTVSPLGYISQQYVTRSTNGERRQTRAYNRFLEEMPVKAGELARQLGQHSTEKSPEVGVMPHMYSMVSLAHDAHAPIADLSSKDGLNGAQFRQRDKYVQDMDTLCSEWIRRMESTVG